jgi:hypothetical protein
MTDNDLMSRELAANELEAISAGFYVTHGGNPPRGEGYGRVEGYGRGEDHDRHHGYEPPRYYPGGSPNSPGLRGFY